YSIILLDEIEKAHPDVFNLLLQALDDGQMTDSLGRKIDFRNTIIIMTSNIGARQLSDFGAGVGFGTKAKEDTSERDNKGVVEAALRKAFAPEFLNRIDDVVMFNSLKREDIHQIIDLELNKLFKRINELGYKIELTSDAKDQIAENGFDEKFGARPLKRAIQKYLEDPLAEEIIKSNLQEGDTIKVGLDTATKDLQIQIVKGTPAPKKKPKKEEENPSED
ncbi:MAG TPA: AAA family ATPase, partial [Flavobacteriales bacterium]|nr:AAA family ATPase [Flavobacteriales bacterium]